MSWSAWWCLLAGAVVDGSAVVFNSGTSVPAKLSASCGGQPSVAWLERKFSQATGYPAEQPVRAYLLNVPEVCTGLSLRQPCADHEAVWPPLLPRPASMLHAFTRPNPATSPLASHTVASTWHVELFVVWGSGQRDGWTARGAAGKGHLCTQQRH